MADADTWFLEKGAVHMEDSSNNKMTLWGYIAAALVGIIVSAIMPIVGPVIGILFIGVGMMAYRGNAMPRIAALILMIAGIGIILMVVLISIFLVKAPGAGSAGVP
jgi:hypothetical protein